MDAISKARLQLINPRLATAVEKLDEILTLEKISFRVVQALRSWDEQEKLYAQGRTAPGKIVTQAAGGHSWHNFGLAVDLAIMEENGQIDWNAAHPAWQRMIQVGEMLGMYSGSHFRTFPDNPHFQMTGRFPISPDDEARVIFRQGGMSWVWAEAGLLDRGEATA